MINRTIIAGVYRRKKCSSDHFLEKKDITKWSTIASRPTKYPIPQPTCKSAGKRTPTSKKIRTSPAKIFRERVWADRFIY